LLLENIVRREINCSATSAGDTTPHVMFMPIRKLSVAAWMKSCSIAEKTAACTPSAPRKTFRASSSGDSALIAGHSNVTTPSYLRRISAFHRR